MCHPCPRSELLPVPNRDLYQPQPFPDDSVFGSTFGGLAAAASRWIVESTPCRGPIMVRVAVPVEGSYQGNHLNPQHRRMHIEDSTPPPRFRGVQSRRELFEVLRTRFAGRDRRLKPE